MKIRQITFLGLMLAVIFVLSTLETIFLALPFLSPYAKPGLANIIIMFCVFCVGRRQAIALNAAKSLFIFLTRGPIAGLLSLSGGMLSVVMIIFLVQIFDGRKSRPKISYAAISVAGACAHNLGQYIMIIFLVATPALVYYLPVLIISGIVTGLLTGTLLKILLPVLKDRYQFFR